MPTYDRCMSRAKLFPVFLYPPILVPHLHFFKRRNRRGLTGVSWHQQFQWGFSFLQVYLILLGMLAWSLGLFFLWLQSYSTAAQAKMSEARVPRFWRSILVLARVLDGQLSSIGLDANALTDCQLERIIRGSLRGGAADFCGVSGSEKASFRDMPYIRPHRSRWRRLSACILPSALPIVCTVYIARTMMPFTYIAVWLSSILMGTLLGLIVIRGDRSRVFKGFYWLMLVVVTAGFVASTIITQY